MRVLRRLMRRARPDRAPFASPPRRRDPSPSRLRYRLDRLSRRGWMRFLLRRALPPLGALGLAAGLLATPTVQQALGDAAERARATLVDRPEFAVTRLTVVGASPGLERRIKARLGEVFAPPVSSLALDLQALRAAVQTTAGVAAADVSVRAGGVLSVAVRQRAPALLWRREGQLHMIDRDGVIIGPLARRADRPDLPLVIGDGAAASAREALALWRRAAPLHDRLRGLQRVGERRWTLILMSDQRVMLPADDPQTALKRLLALNAADDLLDREVTVVDLRDPDRPTLRLTPRGAEELRRLRNPVPPGEDA